MTVPLSREQIEWVLRLCQMAGTLPLDDESRRLNLRVWERVCDAHARTGETAPVPGRGPLHWDPGAELFVREGAGGPGATG